MGRARAWDRRHLYACLAPPSRHCDDRLALFRHPLGSRVDMDSAGDQFLSAWDWSRTERRRKFLCTRRRIDVSVVYGDDVYNQGQLSEAKAVCSAHGSASGWHNESNLFDFHELRRGFSPPNGSSRSGCFGDYGIPVN